MAMYEASTILGMSLELGETTNNQFRLWSFVELCQFLHQFTGFLEIAIEN